MLEVISNAFPRLEVYEKLFPEERMKALILAAYSHVVQFLIMANRTFPTAG